MKMLNRNRNISLLYLMEVCAGLSRGSFLVCIGWTVLALSNNVAIVGQAFIVGMLTQLIGSPFWGVAVDRHDRRKLALLAHAMIALVMITTGIANLLITEFSVIWLFVTIIVVYSFRSLYQSAHDGLIRGFVDQKNLVRAIARFRTAHLLAAMTGTVVAGVLIELFSPAIAFLFSAAASLLLVFVVTFVDSVDVKQKGVIAKPFLSDLREIWQEFCQNRTLQALTI